MVREGDVLAGKYRIEKVLGKGGIGFVVAARHLQLDERVAIKLLLPESVVHPELVARFLREGKAAVKIRSEHVARIHDVGNLENGAPYLVMEYLDGVDLSAHVERVHALPVAEAVDYVLQACVAIAEAHSLGIIHRDLKPANLFLTRRADGSACIKVIDFGISKMNQAGDVTGKGITKTSSPIGSPLYMSPEQMTAAKTVGPQTDIWALGIILFELLTGARVFDGESLAHLYINIATQPPARLTPLRPDVPQALEQIYLRCLEKQAAARFGSVAELAVALAPFSPQAALSVDCIQRTLGHTSKPLVPETLPLSGAATQMLAPPALSSSPARSSPPAPAFSTPSVQTGPNVARIPSASPPAATAGAWGSTGVPTIPMNRGARGLIVLAAAAVVVLGIVVVGVFKFYPRGDGRAAAAPSSGPSAQELPPPESTSVPEAVASAGPSASTARKVPHSSPASHPAAAASPAPAAASAPVPAGRPVASTPPATPAKKPCSWVDAQGQKHFNDECFKDGKKE